MNQHEHFHFGVTIKCDDLYMVSAMRGLAWQCQPEINRNISVAGASNRKWEDNQGKITFYFTSDLNRAKFLDHASRLLPTGWNQLDKDNGKIAPRQS